MATAGSTTDEQAPVPVDEDTFVMPSTWLRSRLPRRGGRGVTARKPDPKHLAEADRLLEMYRPQIDSALDHPESDPALVVAARAHLAGDTGPLGAAVLAVLVHAHLSWSEKERLTVLADRWTVDHGVEFAARAMVELVSLTCGHDQQYAAASEPVPVRRLPRTDLRTAMSLDQIVGIGRRIRAHLATAPDDVYAATVAALATYRGQDLRQRVLTSFLAPTEVTWVDDDCAAVAAADFSYWLATLLVAAVSSVVQFERMKPLAVSYAMSTTMLATFAEGVGPDVAPAVASWLDHNGDLDALRRVLSLFTMLPTDEAFQLLLDRVDTGQVRAALRDAAARFPRRAVRLLAAADGPAVDELLRGHVMAHPDLARDILSELPPTSADRVRAVLEATPQVAQAPASALPPLLVSPPWATRSARPKPVVVTGLSCVDEPTIDWLPGERDTWLAPASVVNRWGRFTGDWEQLVGKFRAGQIPYYRQAGFLLQVPEHLGRPLLASWELGSTWSSDEYRSVVARYELDALPVVLPVARREPTVAVEALLPFTCPEIATLMASCYARLRAVRRVALTWLTRHPVAASRALVPAAVGRAGAARRHAEHALRALAAAGHAPEVTTAAKEYGPQAAAEVEAILAVDPLGLLPAKIPTVPTWTDAHLLPPVRLRDGSGALPVTAVGHLLTMLAVSRLDEPYAGLAVVRDACQPHDLAGLAWAVFEKWRAAGCPPKEDWALHALGLLGDDDTVRRLAPVIRAWPGEGGHTRAVTGLEVLSAIGSDVALMHLHGIAQKVKFRGLRERATEKITEVAAGLGLTAEQLADRLVPDFGLSAEGTLVLDYGPRRFVVGFDEQLKPYITDGAGKRLTALPKPGVKDDPEVAPAAYQRFSGLKKDVRTVAADQIHRFEQAMLWQRRWIGADFRRYLVDHPLVRHVVRRLVWTVHDPAGARTGALRVAEDGSFADVRDEPFVLADDVLVGVAHPVHLGDDLPGWAETFADYEILQPFPQLGREVRRLADDERAAIRLPRYEGVTVPVGRVLGLTRHGWELSAPEDAGMQNSVLRPAPGNLYVVVDLDPGVMTGVVDLYPEQKFTSVRIDRYGSWHGERREPVRFDDLDPAIASEILHDLDEVTR